ncbi:methionine--tRNA ligase [Candidatus Saccharibacteria bacterium]|nr:methionine--tRNA ligase [Candidatus Saccharibacteria bacterium]
MGKKLYIATAIPYVNGKPHIGHVLDFLLADIWVRHQKQNGGEVRFQVGTDEHGNKIAAKAQEAGMTPQEFADQNCRYFKELLSAMKVNYTDFIRTTDPKHKARAQYIWRQLKPYIYQGSYEGWYCEGCEGFVTDKEAASNEMVCPDHKAKYQKISEENYYLKVSEFADQIKEAIESDRMKILPEFRKKEFLALMEKGMPDVSVSRPKKSLSWGIPVPDDDSQVMYVWMDALSNYVTVLGYPDDQEWADYWPADVQVIGKDILRFHAGIWPAMLLGMGLELPKVLLTHGHITVGGDKMSKTVGNVVDPMEVIDKYGLDAFRYYLSRHVTTNADGDFSWEKFENAYNNELVNDLGNLVQRTAGMINKYMSGVIGEIQQPEHDMYKFREAMREMNFSEAMDIIWSLIAGANGFIERVKPWKIAKAAAEGTDPEPQAHLEEVLGHVVGTIMQATEMLRPFLPDAAERISGIFGEGVVKLSDDGVFQKVYIHTADPSMVRADGVSDGGVTVAPEVGGESVTTEMSGDTGA